MLNMPAIMKIWGEQSLMTVLFRNDVENTGTAYTKTSNTLFFVYAVGTKEFANACIHKHIRALTGSTQPTTPPML